MELKEEHELRQWAKGRSVFSAYPKHGARLAEWRFEDQPIIRWPKAPQQVLAKARGGNPILFPFAARTFGDGKEGQWVFQDQVYPMPRHGFARGGRFDADVKEDGFVATLLPTESDREAYPFDYTFSVDYEFRELGLTVILRLANNSSIPIPWSAGHHFYFAIPADARATTTLNLPCRKAWYHQPDGQLGATSLPEQPFSFVGSDMVDRIHTHTSQPVTFGPVGKAAQVSLTFEGDVSDPEWMSVVTWTEAEDSPYYCVEPWMGPPNGPGHGRGLASVAPHATGSFRVHINLVES